MTSAPSAAWRGLMFAPALVAATLASGEGKAQRAADTTAQRGAIFVQVTDTAINPLAAQVVVPALALGVRLSEEGTLLLVDVPDGVYVVEARYGGYRPDSRLIRVTRDTVRIEFALAPADGRKARGRNAAGGRGVAQSRLLDFLNRSGSLSAGSFITRSEIKRRRARTLTALLSRVRDVRLDRTAAGGTVVRSTEVSERECVSGMLVFIDAIRMGAPDTGAVASTEPVDEPPRGNRRSWRLTAGTPGLRPTVLRSVGAGGREQVGAAAAPGTSQDAQRQRTGIDRVPIASVVAVEVYPAFVGVPLQFRVPGAECGVLLIWTERGGPTED